jgi:hypothetical protein
VLNVALARPTSSLVGERSHIIAATFVRFQDHAAHSHTAHKILKVRAGDTFLVAFVGVGGPVCGSPRPPTRQFNENQRVFWRFVDFMAQTRAAEVQRPFEVPHAAEAACTMEAATAGVVRGCTVHGDQDDVPDVVQCKAASLIRDNADVAVEVAGAGASSRSSSTTQCEGSMAAVITSGARHRAPHDGDGDAAGVSVSLVALEDTFALRKEVLRPWLTHEMCLEMYGGGGEHFDVGAFVNGCTGGEPPLVR